MGQKSGVPDIMIYDNRQGHNGFAIELKVDYNKPSANQKWWLDALGMCGWKTMWTNSLDEFISEVDKYFDLE
jgi:hypothetical protein